MSKILKKKIVLIFYKNIFTLSKILLMGKGTIFDLYATYGYGMSQSLIVFAVGLYPASWDTQSTPIDISFLFYI